MEIYTIGFTQKSAEEFFETLRKNRIRLLIDVRLKNTSHLAGFAKMEDLEYFLRKICDIKYKHMPILAPTEEVMDRYKKQKGGWEEYKRSFEKLLEERKVSDHLDKGLFKQRVVLLCAEPKAENCHRKLVAEYLSNKWGDVEIVHL